MDEITKEGTISYGCKEGYHHLSPGNSMIVGDELRMKCLDCGAEISQPSPISGVPRREDLAPKSNMETVPDTSKHGEPTLAKNPYDEINERSKTAPPWAEHVKSRYEQDKTLDDFFADIKKRAGQ